MRTLFIAALFLSALAAQAQSSAPLHHASHVVKAKYHKVGHNVRATKHYMGHKYRGVKKAIKN